MEKVIFYLYFFNSMLLIIHEIDSAYWKEWRQFRETFGWFRSDNDDKNMTIFLILHFPLIGLILWGLVETYIGSNYGLIISLIIASGGLFAFFFHTYWLRKGRKEFDALISKWNLRFLLLISACQFVLTVYALIFSKLPA